MTVNGVNPNDGTNPVNSQPKAAETEKKEPNENTIWTKLDSDGDGKFTYFDEVYKDISVLCTLGLGAKPVKQPDGSARHMKVIFQAQEWIEEISEKLVNLLGKPIKSVGAEIRKLYIEAMWISVHATYGPSEHSYSEAAERSGEAFDKKYGRQDEVES